MGSASSKAARGGSAAARQYPTRGPGAAAQTIGNTQAQAQAQAQAARTTSAATPQAKAPPAADADTLDTADPDFAPSGFSKRLNDMGIVKPNPTFSPSSRAGTHMEHAEAPAGPLFAPSRSNPTLTVLEARRKLQALADEDTEAVNRLGSKAQRRFVDMRTLVDAMDMLERGHSAKEVEGRFGLQPGLLGKLGKKGVLQHLSGGAVAQ